METFKENLGDCLLWVLDEVKFWGEVIAAFMEWDEESHQRWADEQMKAMQGHIRDLKVIEEKAIKKRTVDKKQKDVNNEFVEQERKKDDPEGAIKR